ncbi:MAG: RluA family pseudouridine synthase [Candidatus Cloacimonadota bacterium]|nr:RluA family pseudouridine synthase [Candidatus Cloacimonadota bacterium]
MKILKTHIVPQKVGKFRLSDYTREVFNEFIPSRNGIKKAIKNNLILVDDMPARTGYWVKPSQKITLLEAHKPKQIFKYVLPVNFEDNYLAVISKPAGLLVNGNQFRTIENALEYNLYPSSLKDALAKMKPVHRLDSLTNGLLIIAKTKSSQKKLDEMFKQHKINKRYIAIVMGKIPSEGEIERKVDNKEARTIFKRLKVVPSLKSGYLSLVNLWLESGRTHQLRKHLSWLGFPILGDKLYGQKGNIFKGKGLFLAAVELNFQHPFTCKHIKLTIALPNKFYIQLQREERRYLKFNAK